MLDRVALDPSDCVTVGDGARSTETPAYPERSRSTSVLVVGLASLLFVQALAPVAWVMANHELAAIDRGRRDPHGRRDARLGRVLGIFGTVALAVGWVLLVLHVLGLITLPGA